MSWRLYEKLNSCNDLFFLYVFIVRLSILINKVSLFIVVLFDFRIIWLVILGILRILE